MNGPVEPWEAAASLVLVVIAVWLSRWRKVGVEGSIAWAAVRAAVQLVAVGLLFEVIFESALSMLWAVIWVGVMVVISAQVMARRAPSIRGMRSLALLAIGGSVAIALGVTFGLGVFELEPITLVVIAGITIGNTLPSGVLAADQVSQYVKNNRSEIEGLLALGFDASSVSRFITPITARTALIPQIERTKVVGLIALPGAMTGMLLAGAKPIDAVMVQIVIMYLVLGSVAVAVLLVTTVAAARVTSRDLRLGAR